MNNYYDLFLSQGNTDPGSWARNTEPKTHTHINKQRHNHVHQPRRLNTDIHKEAQVHTQQTYSQKQIHACQSNFQHNNTINRTPKSYTILSHAQTTHDSNTALGTHLLGKELQAEHFGTIRTSFHGAKTFHLQGYDHLENGAKNGATARKG